MTDIQKVLVAAAGLAVLGGGVFWANYIPPFEASPAAKAQWSSDVVDCNSRIRAWDAGDKATSTADIIGLCRHMIEEDALLSAKAAKD